jgi:hypothetical protein
MITAEDINLLVIFDSSTKKFVGVDQTDYTGLGESTTGLFGLLESESPVGTLLDLLLYTSPWIDLNSGLRVSSDADLPVNTGLGTALFGVYQFLYTVQRRYNNTGILKTSGSSDVILIGDQQANIVVGTKLTLTTVDGDEGTYTVTAVAYDGGTTQTTVTLSSAMTFTGTATGVFITDIARTYDYCYEDLIPKPVIDLSSSCFSGVFKSEDNTQYGNSTINARTHRVMYPRKVNGNAVAPDIVDSVIATSKILQTNSLWTGAWNSSLSVTGLYTQTDGLQVTWSIKAVDSLIVDCLNQANKARNCIMLMLAKFQRDCMQGTSGMTELHCDLMSVNTLSITMGMFEETGDTNSANANARSIIEIANKYGCGCSIDDSDSEPQLVVASNIVGSLLQTLPLTTAGDILYRNSLNETDRLPLGTLYHVLTAGGLVPYYDKPQGDLFFVATSAYNTAPGSYTVIAGYISEDFEGVEYFFNIRSSSGGYIRFTVNGEEISIQVLLSGFYYVRMIVLREGTDWKFYLTLTSPTASTSASSTVPAVGALAFDQPLEIICTQVLTSPLIQDHVVRYLRKKKLAV